MFANETVLEPIQIDLSDNEDNEVQGLKQKHTKQYFGIEVK